MEEKDRLREQIAKNSEEVRNAGRKEWTTYTRIQKRINTLKAVDIILTAVSSVGIISFFFHGNLQINVVTSFVTLASLSLNLYTSSFRDDDEVKLHQAAAGELWNIEKGYESLLTDFESLSPNEARERRDSLVAETARINSQYLSLNAVNEGRRKKREAK